MLKDLDTKKFDKRRTAEPICEREHPKITVITVVLNDKKGLERTILSVKGQVYENLEYIVIDGDSKDGTTTVIEENLELIDFWISDCDEGIYDAMNKGIDMANGDWIIFMNAGDTFKNDQVLKELTNYKIQPETRLIYGDVNTQYESFERVMRAGKLNMLKYGMVFSHQSALFKTEWIKENKYDTCYQLAADYKQIMGLYLENTTYFQYFPITIATVDVLGIANLLPYRVSIEYLKINSLFGKSTISLQTRYYLRIIKDYIKSKFVPQNFLNFYRSCKYRR